MVRFAFCASIIRLSCVRLILKYKIPGKYKQLFGNGISSPHQNENEGDPTQEWKTTRLTKPTDKRKPHKTEMYFSVELQTLRGQSPIL